MQDEGAAVGQAGHTSNLQKCRQRKIPFAREEAVNAELERLVQQGVLKKVDYTDCCSC